MYFYARDYPYIKHKILQIYNSCFFLTRFFPHFPDCADQSIDAMLDLCEDPAVDIRKQAIKDLPTLCRDNKANLPKITDVLTQVYQGF